MAVQVNVTLSESIYSSIQKFAQQRRQNITETIAEAIAGYLEQNPPIISDNTEALHSESVQELAVANERQAYLEMHPTLLKQYPAHYIAIHKGKLIDHDLDKLDLYTRIEKAYPHEFVFMRRVEPAPEQEIVFHSLRFAEEE